MAFEKEAVVISVRNLLTYPYIQERINKNTLKIFIITLVQKPYRKTPLN